MTKPTLSIFTAPQGLGTIYQEKNQINVKFLDVNLPFSTTTGRASFNFGGKNRIIMLQGKQDGTNFDGITQEDKIADFISDMENEWINKGIQDSVQVIYTDSFGNEYTVDAVDWEWTRSNDTPNVILWSLIMKEY